MKKLIIVALVATVAVYVISCARGITVGEAANGKAKCGRHLK